MTKFTIKTGRLIGFATEKAESGQQARILVKNKLLTSDSPIFHIYMQQISSIFLLKTKIPLVLMHKFLILLHNDNTADIYINDFPELAKVKVKNSTKAGEKIYRNNVSDISDLRFSDIKIKEDDAIIYCLRTDWRFSLYFDFTREIKLEILSKELGELKKEAEFYNILIKSELKRINNLDADAIIFTEGKSDWKHLKKATAKLNIQKNLILFEEEKDIGSDDLLKMCEHYSRILQLQKMIFVFDRDEKRIIKELDKKTEDGKKFQTWGNNVYSFYLPVPPHRSEKDCDISIEFFYSNEEIVREDKNSRRLYLSNEFNQSSGKHNVEKDIHCQEINKIKRDKLCIIDNSVFNKEDKNIALPKDDFACHILDEKLNFDNFGFENFESIFEIIEEILSKK